MKCPNCGSDNCEIINGETESQQNFSAGKGCLGALLLGPIGLLAGLCGAKKKTETKHYWLCKNCGKKWEV